MNYFINSTAVDVVDLTNSENNSNMYPGLGHNIPEGVSAANVDSLYSNFFIDSDGPIIIPENTVQNKFKLRLEEYQKNFFKIKNSKYKNKLLNELQQLLNTNFDRVFNNGTLKENMDNDLKQLYGKILEFNKSTSLYNQ